MIKVYNLIAIRTLVFIARGVKIIVDIFDKYLFEELIEDYNKPNLSQEDYEELYQRFCNKSYIEDTKPYLCVLRFFGLGTVADKDVVLEDLKTSLDKDNGLLKGLYYDLLLHKKSNDKDIAKKLKEQIKAGYTDIYTKDKSNIEIVDMILESTDKEAVVEERDEVTEANIEVEYMTFLCGSYSGIYFASGDVDYIHAQVFIKPVNSHKHITVRSQIFINEEPWSQVFTDEFDLTKETRWFKTNGWGNATFDCYSSNTYKWEVSIDDRTAFSQSFQIYDGNLLENGAVLNKIKPLTMSNDLWKNFVSSLSQSELESQLSDILSFACKYQQIASEELKNRKKVNNVSSPNNQETVQSTIMNNVPIYSSNDEFDKGCSEKIYDTIYSLNAVTEKHCYLDDGSENILNKVVAIKADIFLHEYQTLENQLFLVVDGKGSRANVGRGKLECVNIFNDQIGVFDRQDVLGRIKPSCLPIWAKKKLETEYEIIIDTKYEPNSNEKLLDENILDEDIDDYTSDKIQQIVESYDEEQLQNRLNELNEKLNTQLSDKIYSLTLYEKEQCEFHLSSITCDIEKPISSEPK